VAAKRIGVFVGSLRKESFSRKTAKALIALAPGELTLEIVEIGGLEMYNQDLEETPPESWVEFRRRVRSLDGVLFVTPEYNRSIPAVLKNAIDVGSRPTGKNCWDGKPGAVVSVAPGRLGAFGANHHLRQSLVYLNVPAMAQPEAYISGAAKIFDESGMVLDESTREFLGRFVTAFAAWIEKHSIL
jgi:chromate reductase